MSVSQRLIFGGAITCELPTTFRDVSTMRQVYVSESSMKVMFPHYTHSPDLFISLLCSPDNQEVYSLPNEGGDPNIPGPCIIVELLEYQKQLSDQEAATYYFKDLAEANGVAGENMTFAAQSLSVTPTFTNLSAFSSGIGMQNINPGLDVDVAGNPRPSNPVWVKVEIGVFRLESVGTDLLVTLSVPIVSGAEVHGFSETFHRAVVTLSIHNWGLFGS